ncbi:MAG TPA: hypothetical protein VKC54_03710 [Patescibacteria group bacterium]|nr:hypothetical protein [Patescibacteria group bacterium]
MLKEALKLFLQKGRAVAIIVIGTLAWSWTMVKSGWLYSYGLGFWGANGHDGVWHIALIESLAKGTFRMPVFSGADLQNYHIGFDLMVALIYKITHVPVVNLYFQIIPPILAIFVGVLTYNFVFEWTKSKNASLWSTFFVYFGSGFGFLIGKGESAFWSQQAISSLINPPFALSLIFILLGLISLQKFTKTENTKYLIMSTLCFGLLIEVKIYAGLLVLGGLFVASIYDQIKNNKSGVTKTFLLSFGVSLVLFLLFEKGSGSLLVWQPFWFLETMMGLTDRLGWLRFFSAMNTYKSGHIWLKAIPAYFIALVIFYIGNLGTRMIKEFLVWKWLKNIKLIEWTEVFMSSIIVVGVIVPMLFLQKGTPWNTIQFFYYSLFFSAILAGIGSSQILENSKTLAIRYFKAGLIIFLTIPTTLFTLKEVYIPMRPPAMVSKEELSALKFLSAQPEGIVLTYPFDPTAAKIAEVNPPRPLYLYVSTAYVSAFSKQQTFLEDEVNLDITGYNWQQRRQEVVNWYKEKDQVKAREFLKTKGIKYVYWLRGQRAFLGEAQLGLTNIFEDSSVILYRVD